MPGVNCVNGPGQCTPEDKGIGAYVRRYPPFKQSAPFGSSATLLYASGFMTSAF